MTTPIRLNIKSSEIDMNRTAFILAFIGVAATSSLALANDTAIPFIPVDSIETDMKSGSELKFTGKEAAKLMQILPKVAHSTPSDWSNRSAALLVQSPKYNVVLSCNDIDPSDIRKRATPECYFTFRRNDQSEIGEKNLFNPKTQCTE